jgi:hypothetical protein
MVLDPEDGGSMCFLKVGILLSDLNTYHNQQEQNIDLYSRENLKI